MENQPVWEKHGNITDVGHLEHDADEGEDKIAKKARLEQLEPMEIAQYYTNRYHQYSIGFAISSRSSLESLLSSISFIISAVALPLSFAFTAAAILSK